MKMLSILLIFLNIYSQNNNCILIKGGGFSGFWYFYGVTKVYPDDKIFCYSSGCLAVVSTIHPNNFNKTISNVLNIKNDYNSNIIKLFDIREKFIDNIINIDINNYNINIIVSNYLGQCIIKKPNNIKELKKLLLETTDIPFITSHFNIKKNIDGIFCKLQHPKCNRVISIPKTFKFIINILNPNLNIKDVYYFYNYIK